MLPTKLVNHILRIYNNMLHPIFLSCHIYLFVVLWLKTMQNVIFSWVGKVHVSIPLYNSVKHTHSLNCVMCCFPQPNRWMPLPTSIRQGLLKLARGCQAQTRGQLVGSAIRLLKKICNPKIFGSKIAYMAARMLDNHSCRCIIHSECTKALENPNRYIKIIQRLS